MGTHNLCFVAEIRKIMYTPANPIFFYIKVGFEGSKLHRRVFMMELSAKQTIHMNVKFLLLLIMSSAASVIGALRYN